MLRLSIENPAEVIPQIRPLLALNWAETGFDFDFAPDVGMYQTLYDAGAVFAVIAKVDEEIVGYCTVCVTPHPHNATVMIAANDALFVHPEHRSGSIGARVIRFAEICAKEMGANRFLWHCRAGTPLADTLERHGYKPADVVVMKELHHGI